MPRFPVRDDHRRPVRYRVVAGFFRLVFRVYFFRRLHFEGFEAIPKTGALLVASNHLSNLDPLIFGAFFPGTLFAMAKKEVFKSRFVGWVLRGCNTFPVDRATSDRRALTTAIDLLKDGDRLMIFVEGTRARSPGMKRAEGGAGFLQRRSGAAVLPMAVWGSEKALVRGSVFPRRSHIHLRIGKVFEMAPGAVRADDQAASDRIATAIAELLPVEYRGAYGEASAADA